MPLPPSAPAPLVWTAPVAHGAALPAPWHTCFDELRGQALPPDAAQPAAWPAATLAPAWALFFSLLPPQAWHSRPAPLPLLLHAREWQAIEAGVQQRLRLLQTLLQDTYGPRRLLQGGQLPAALVQGHPDYLRPMHGARPAGGLRLHWAAFDVLRDAQGQWWLQAQRTQAPAGLGQWLAQRALSAQHYGPALARLGVQPLQAGVQAFTQHLLRACQADQPDSLALLSADNAPDGDAACLARHLGLPLLSGPALSVRQRRLYRLDAPGAQAVRGLLKLLPDAWLDPLELRPDARAGVPGLLHAARAGHILLANPPGAGFAESRALLGFMPALAHSLLGQPLRLPALHTWWCGEASALQAALPRLGQCVVRPTYPGAASRHAFAHGLGPLMSPDALRAWTRAITQSPEEHTLQQYAPPARLPAWPAHSSQPGLSLRPYRLRVFALADGPDHWRVLPGGLVCLDDALGGWADAWVCAPTPAATP